MRHAKALILYWLYWILFFVAARSVFYLFNLHDAGNSGWGILLKASQHGLELDMSAASYLSIFIFLTYAVRTILKKEKWGYWLMNVYHVLALALAVLIVITDARLYPEWGYKIDSSIMTQLKQPQGAIDSMGWMEMTWLLLLVAGLFIGFFLLWSKLRNHFFKSIKPSKAGTAIGVLFSAVIIVPIRGGLGNTPLSISSAYYSSNIFENHLACNTLWNFGFSFTGNSFDAEKWRVSTLADVKKLNEELTQSSSAYYWQSKKSKPNVILVVLESFTAGILPQLGGLSGYAPNLERLMREGINFTNCYASGDRSDEGLATLFTGFPGFPGGSILELPAKASHLPNVLERFNSTGYYTAFVCGSDLNFANIRTLLTNGKADKIIESKNFHSNELRGKWGVHDAWVFQYALDEAYKNTNPYFLTIYSISSHAPYDVPVDFGFNGENADFFTSIKYTDSCLGVFINGLKKSPSWGNTLLFITADHGVRSPGNCAVNSPEKYHVPFVITGGALDTSFQIDQVVSHTDVPLAMLYSAGIKDQRGFVFSRNPLEKNNEGWAAYLYTSGIGIVTKSDTAVFDLKLNKASESWPGSHSNQVRARAYLHSMADWIEAN